MKTRAWFCALLLATSGTAFAQGNPKLYPGASCVPVGGRAATFSDGLIRNSSTSTLTVNCPIVRDEAGSIEVRVYLEDKHPSQNISCYTSSLNDLSYTGWWSASISSAGTTSPAAPGWLDLPRTTGTGSTYAYVTCTLPPSYSGQNSGIRSLFVREL